MSTVLEPRGPLPPQVYWTRRLVVLGAVLLVIIVIWALVARGGGGEASEPGATSDPDVTETDDADDADPPGDGASTCGAADLELAVATEQRAHPAGVQPVLEVTVTNVSESSCVVDLAATQVLITSGSDRIWSSADCPADDVAEQVVLLPAGAVETWTTTWQRVRSDEQCGDGLPEPRPGTYRVEVSLVGASSEQTVFDLD